MSPAYIIALICGLVVTIASLFVKRATAEGAGVTRILFITNWLFLLGLLPVLFTDATVLDASRWWAPVLAGSCAFLGGVCILSGIRAGEISIQTPLMGTKVIFVATYSVMLSPMTIPLCWWIGAFLTFFAVLILGFSDLFKKKVSLEGILYALMSCGLYAFTDVLAATQGPLFGRGMFIFYTVGSMALLSLTLIPFFKKSLWSISKTTWIWCLLGGGLLALQHLGLLYSLSTYGQATAINILYSTRGIWGIVLVWFVGHWFGNKEKHVGGPVILRRLIGASLLMMAIIIVLTGS